MRAWPRLLAAFALWFAVAGPASAERIVAAVSTHLVAITSKFSGAELVVFGVIERDANTVSRAGPHDIVVSVRGPRRMVQVREKRRLGPIWVNRDDRRFVDAPGFFAIVSSRPIDRIVDRATRDRLGLGLAEGVRPSLSGGYDDPDEPVFRTALVRLMAQDGLYVANDRGVTFLTPEFFRAPVTLPAATPIGIYDVEIALFADGVQIARQQTNFELTKRGFERFVAQAAAEHAWLYGLAAAALALFGGWAGALAFRRD